MAVTPKWGFPLLAEGQASAEISHNEALNLLEGLTHIAILDRNLATPPGSPAEGDAYLVAASPTGVWTGLAGKFVFFYGGGWIPATAGTPTGLAPKEGMHVWIMDEDRVILYDGSAWINPPLYVENLSAAPSSSSANKGRITFNTSTGNLQVDDGSTIKSIIAV